jgi:hypothetical protein
VVSPRFLCFSFLVNFPDGCAHFKSSLSTLFHTRSSIKVSTYFTRKKKGINLHPPDKRCCGLYSRQAMLLCNYVYGKRKKKERFGYETAVVLNWQRDVRGAHDFMYIYQSLKQQTHLGICHNNIHGIQASSKNLITCHATMRSIHFIPFATKQSEHLCTPSKTKQFRIQNLARSASLHKLVCRLLNPQHDPRKKRD